MKMNALVATKDSESQSLELLVFFLEKFLRAPRHTKIRERLNQHLRSPDRPETIERLVDFIEAFLKEPPLDDINEIALYEDALTNLWEHRRATERNVTAYDVAGKANPDAIYWPDPSAPAPYCRPIYGALVYSQRPGGITRQSRIGSAGSCFALEIRKYLIERSYNYVITERNGSSCCNWGAQYNSIAFQQTVEWAFGMRERPLLLWEDTIEEEKPYCDAFREGVRFTTTDEATIDTANHRRCAREALEGVEYLILTIGLNEVWRLSGTNTAIARFPRRMDPNLIEYCVLSVEENVKSLQTTLDVLRAHNPEIKIIITVSPVPLHATFQGHEKHVITATQHAKSVLRVAVDEFVKRNPEQATYFPAFETVLWCTEHPWQPDMRHVSPEAVSNVMRLFEAMFLNGA
jgi:hypothetical protein